MSYLRAVPLVIYILGGGLLGLISWGFIKFKTHPKNNLWDDTRDDPLLWLLLLAVFTTGVFIAYVLFASPG